MSAPLADKIRPKSLADVVGQEHILAEGKPLRRIIESGTVPNMIFYGPSGVGKTTVARIIAENFEQSRQLLDLLRRRHPLADEIQFFFVIMHGTPLV